jgi:hypothetical protein
LKITLEVISPKGKKLFDTARLLAEIDHARQQTQTDILNDFKKTTATWKHRVVWYSTRRGNDVFIGTKDEIYGYVDNGTDAHIIRPRNPKGTLAFYRTGFKAKTRVGYIDSYNGSTANKNMTYTKLVHHPGTAARNFTKKIYDKWAKQWGTRVRQALRNSIEK